MPEVLKPYEPTEKGRELIALLFPLTLEEREKKLEEYKEQYEGETQALLDGFHFIVQEVMESRHAGMDKEVIALPDAMLNAIIGTMLEEKNFFAYSNISDFFYAISKTSPPVFKNADKIDTFIKKHSRPKSENRSTSDFPEAFEGEVEQKFKAICHAAQEAYQELSRIQRSLMNSQKIIDEYKDKKNNISLVEFKLAKETFMDTKQVFLKNGKIIADGMKFVYDIYQNYPDEIVVKKAYIKYLAKLLGSREARYPPEKYVLNQAHGDFDFAVPSFDPTDRQLQHGKTKYSLRKEYEQILLRDIHRLEARYRKRKLTALLKSETSKSQIIGELQEILKLDPSDIRTHIFIARLLADSSNALNNHIKRGVLREQALKHCQAAFSKIDDYLDLQDIKDIKDRDLARSGFVKTISAIRIPLLRKG